jgi:hypothetical protein
MLLRRLKNALAVVILCIILVAWLRVLCGRCLALSLHIVVMGLDCAGSIELASELEVDACSGVDGLLEIQ